MEAAEQEVRLAARLPRLAREERDRLRVAIAHLLALHGFSASEIRLNGEAEPGQRL